MALKIQTAESIFFEHQKEIARDFVEVLREELEGQGHRASGRLINSVEDVVAATLDGFNTDILHNSYGRYQNTGVSARRIPFSPGSGKRTSQFINALAQWVKLKKFTSGLDKDILGAAFAIAKKMKKEGMPTSGAFKHSKNGRRTKWLFHSWKVFRKDAFLRMDVATEEYISYLLDSLIESFIAQFSGMDTIKLNLK